MAEKLLVDGGNRLRGSSINHREVGISLWAEVFPNIGGMVGRYDGNDVSNHNFVSNDRNSNGCG